MSFGQKGGLLFAFLNVLQLVGWTAIMIYDGALAVGGIFDVGRWVWCLVIGALIILWIAVGITEPGLDQQDDDGRAVYPHAGAVQGDLLLRQRRCAAVDGESHDLRRSGGAGRGHAPVLAAR